jgi:hypothetical protein
VELGAARVCGERRPEVEFTAVASMADGGGSGSRAGRLAGFYRQACLGEGGSRASPHGGPRHGQGGGEARRPIAAQGGAVRVRRRHRWLAAQVGSVRLVSVRRVEREDWVRTSVQKPWDRRSQRCSGSRARSAGGATRRVHAHDVARGRARVALVSRRI